MSTTRAIAFPETLPRRVDPSAVVALFGLTVARLVRGRRLLVLSLLFALPVGFALLAQRYDRDYDADDTTLILVLGLIPQTLVPLTALVYASGMIQDEIEEQTLTYLLIRPLPRTAVYLVKLAGTVAVTAGIAAVFTTITLGVVHRSDSAEALADLPGVAVKILAAMTLAIAAYGALFGLVGLYLRRVSLALGVAYIAVVEGVLANIDFVVRKATIMYQFRVLTVRWLDLAANDWNLDLKAAPSAAWAAMNLAIAAALLAGVGALAFARREFRLKTPEGS